MNIVLIGLLLAGTWAPGVGAVDGPSDAWLSTTTKIAILTSIGVAGSTIQVDTLNATITLFGKVASLADKVSMEKLARDTPGVREVRNLLIVEPAAGRIGKVAPDLELQSTVAVALIAAGLKRESPLAGSDVSVQSVDAGVVLLTGSASLMGLLRAIETARNVRGVGAVRSLIRVTDTVTVRQALFIGR
jgi:osmotically-inducible protein OsmY